MYIVYNTASIESEVQLCVYLNDIIHYHFGVGVHCYLGNTTIQERYIITLLPRQHHCSREVYHYIVA